MKNLAISQSVLRRLILDAFPSDAGLRRAFAYGSVAFPQHGGSTANSQLDLILIVDDPFVWHTANFKQNPSHYSTLVRGPHTQRLISGSLGAHVYYHPFVSWFDSTSRESLCFKYGVTSMANLLSDLLTWSKLYLAGRLHKPVLWIPPENSNSFDQLSVQNTLFCALERNLLAALSFALLQIAFSERTFSEYDLFHAVASISYDGDWRRIIGVDQTKVDQLVTGSTRLAQFRELYHNAFMDPAIHRLLHTHADSSEAGSLNQIHWNNFSASSDTVIDLLSKLPDSVCSRAARFAKSDTPDVLSRPLLAEMGHKERRHYLKQAVQKTVRNSSIQQTALGVVSAGLIRAFRYANAKLTKCSPV